MDGYEATRRIKTDPAFRDIPIIVVTSYALSGGDEAKARAAGCDDFVPKPFSPRQLLAKNSEVAALAYRRVRCELSGFVGCAILRDELVLDAYINAFSDFGHTLLAERSGSISTSLLARPERSHAATRSSSRSSAARRRRGRSRRARSSRAMPA